MCWDKCSTLSALNKKFKIGIYPRRSLNSKNNKKKLLSFYKEKLLAKKREISVKLLICSLLRITE
jgi:hypothetical protein